MLMMRKTLLAAAVLLVTAAGVFTAAEAATPVTVLANGLVVIVRENHANPVATVRVFVRTGSIYEGKYLGSGISHFTEHLVSGGSTKWHPEYVYDKLRAQLGGNGNASTSNSITRYYIDTTGANVFKAIDVLSEWMRGASISWPEFLRERGVVQRELELARDRPGTVIYYSALANMFKVHPVRHPIIGHLDQLKAIKRDDIVRYYRERYVPNNMVVVVVGDFDAAKVKAHIEETFGEMARKTLPAMVLPEEPVQVGPRRVVLEREAARIGRLRVQYRTVKLTHPDLYPLDVLSFILSKGPSSRLVRKLRDEKSLVTRIVTTSYTPDWGDGVFSINVQLRPEKLDEVVDAIVAELDRLKTEGVTEEELARAKKQKITEHERGRQTVGQQAEELGRDYLSTFDADFSARYTRNIQKVTPEEIREVARKYFGADKRCVTALVPKGTAAKTAARPAAVVTSRIRRVVLPNGVVALLKQNTATSIVSVQAFLGAGLRAETRSNNGICRLTALMMRRGTTTRSAQDIARAFDSMGAHLSINSGSNALYAATNVLAKDLTKAIEILADALLNPSFPQDELTKIRERMVFNIRRGEAEPMTQAERFFRENLFLTSPYGMMPEGTVQSVSRLTRDDLVRFHRTYVHPLNLKIAVFGDVKPADAEALVRKHFGNFRGDGRFRPRRPALEPPLTESRTALKVTKKKGAVIFVGAPGVTVRDVTDRAVIAVIDTVLSGYGYPRGWLHAALRGRGLVYVVHAYNVPGIEKGSFVAYAQCQPSKVKEVARIMMENVRKIAIHGASNEEIRTAKTLIVTTESLRRQRNETEARNAVRDELYGIGHNYTSEFLRRVMRVTNDDIKRVTRKYLRNYVLTVTTPDASIARDVSPKPRIVR